MEIMQHVLKMQLISLLPKYIKLIYMGIFFYAFVYADIGCLKVNARKFYNALYTCIILKWF